MRNPHLAWLSFAALAAVAPLGSLAGCGDRTGLLVPVVLENETPESGSSGSASGDDAGDDTTEIPDALPPVDVTVPDDAFSDCPDAGATYIYVVGEGGGLYSFYPPTGTFRRIGTLRCPDPTASATPFSMAVDHSGTAYVLYNDGSLFRVSTATADCRPTPFVSGQGGFDSRFGMGYSRDAQGTGETLYVIGESGDLATIDTTNFSLHRIGAVSPTLESAELTGTGGGDLFAFYATTGGTPCPNHNCMDSAIGQINKVTGQETNQSVLKGVAQGQAWAFAFWGGDFYTFTGAVSGGTQVTRYRPTDGSIVTVGTRPDFMVVGAGVSTCAPAR